MLLCPRQREERERERERGEDAERTRGGKKMRRDGETWGERVREGERG